MDEPAQDVHTLDPPNSRGHANAFGGLHRHGHIEVEAPTITKPSVRTTTPEIIPDPDRL
jgi:hypothetical protein